MVSTGFYCTVMSGACVSRSWWRKLTCSRTIWHSSLLTRQSSWPAPASNRYPVRSLISGKTISFGNMSKLLLWIHFYIFWSEGQMRSLNPKKACQKMCLKYFYRYCKIKNINFEIELSVLYVWSLLLLNFYCFTVNSHVMFCKKEFKRLAPMLVQN